MLNPKVQEAFNKQLNAELASGYLYLSMAAHFEAQNFQGVAGWLRAQAREELGHAMKFYDFINDRDGRVTLAAIGAPPTQWKSPLDAFEDAYRHEVAVSGMIDDLVNLALAEKDYMAKTFLDWFVSEQVEEEANVLLIVDKLKLVGDEGLGLFMMDNELGQRAGGSAAAPETT